MVITTIIIFLIVLAALIFMHELGHFVAARGFGIRVDEFALGFGPRLWSKKKGETTYAINAIPFGGFVKIFGENPDDESTHGPDSSRSFANVARWKQAVVLVSGVVGNFIFAWLLVAIALSIGAAASPQDYPQYASRMSDQHIVIDGVTPGSPADKAGIMAGDSIQSLTVYSDGKEGHPATYDFPITDAQDLGVSNIQEDIDSVGYDFANATPAEKDAIMANPNIQALAIEYRRGDTVERAAMIPVQGLVPGKYAIGISMEDAATLRLPFYLAAYESVRFTWSLMQEIVIGFGALIAGLFQGTASVSNLTGPVGIASLVGTAARLGFSYLLMFTAFISVNLGIINLVPFPALDGGRLLFVIIEAVIRRPIKAAIANAFNFVGFALLMILMVFVTYKDILRLFH